ncbi:thermopsin family protease [Thermogymnomonas acidicola]|uniref:thermopsin family protease n=1 Tax=Thermogymnomonas acidicola TaxID=399579 RepID=UPI00149490EF|nr:thermopsin family protease [Thermogymnomonas acidicola]
MVNATQPGRDPPEVTFYYNDGYGWVAFDTVTFTFATNVSGKPVFEVNGFQYEPTGYTFYDAELILGGPGNGTGTQDMDSNVYLSLLYYNGHNFQEIANAYNFGSNTAETLWNATDSAYYYPQNGSLFALVKNSSTGDALGTIYTSNEVSFLNISTGFYSGYVEVNNTGYAFSGWSANLTLAPRHVRGQAAGQGGPGGIPAERDSEGRPLQAPGRREALHRHVHRTRPPTGLRVGGQAGHRHSAEGRRAEPLRAALQWNLQLYRHIA